MPIVVRVAVPADAEFIANSNLAMALESENTRLDAARLRQGVAAVFSEPARGFYLVAEWDGARCGCLLVTTEWSDWRNAVFWWIQSVYVVPERRRRGVYAHMHAETLKRARAAGSVCGLRLYVDAQNRAAQATYKSLGMESSHYVLMEQTIESNANGPGAL
ncbi:MAG: N-acetyltransferase family protein [Planctomycetota bacterium]